MELKPEELVFTSLGGEEAVSPSVDVQNKYGYEIYIYSEDNILLARYYDYDGYVYEESIGSWISIDWIPGILEFKVTVEENTSYSGRDAYIKFDESGARYHGRIRVRQDGKI